MDTIDYPVNNGDIDGIYKYLAWHMYKAGLSSNCFHYLEVLKRAAEQHYREENSNETED